MPKKKVEVYDKKQLIYPFIENDHVTFSNGMKVSEMLDQGISMPTVTHNETSFKAGVGDSDVSSSIVDSSVSKMVIKGQMYQNILPEPSTHVLTNNKEMFKVNEGLDPNVEIVDGVSKSAILSGQTLVNCLGTPRGGSSTASYSNGVLNFSDVWSGQNYDFTPVVKPNTQYTAIFFLSTPIPTNRNLAIGYLADGSWQGTNYYKLGDGVSNVVRVKIASGDTNDRLRVRYDSATSQTATNVAISMRIVVLEGDWTNKELPFNNGFKGMASCEMPVLQTIGKNLFDGELEVGSLSANTGDVESDNSFKRTVNFIRINPNKEYRMRANGTVNGRVYFYDINKSYISTQLNESRLAVPSNAKYLKFRIGADVLSGGQEIQLEEGSAPTPYEPYKTNILHTPEEVVLRSLPNGVCDTLNCMTGEYVQRIKEVVFDGSSDESIDMANVNDTTLVRFNINNVAGVQTGNTNKVLCSSLPYLYIHDLSGGSATVSQECISNHSTSANTINIVIKRSRLSSVDVAGFRAYLQSNPITIQYSIATPIVKTVDLSSSGNWEKIVLDGSENWESSDSSMPLTHRFTCYGNTNDRQHGVENIICDNMQVKNVYNSDEEGILGSQGGTQLYLRVLKSKLPTTDVNGLKQYLQQNPITVWYQTTNHKDSTQVKQPIFFKDGHIQLSSGADNSLIPTLDYQAKTSNSYVMDLMKANTRYTMKAKSASGTFTIDGTSYGAGTNGTFTTPSSMTNKLLVMSNKTNKEVMILEGDVTSKTIPYFKGIKSAFEGEDKIEVLSSNCANLFHPKDIVNNTYWELDVTGKAKIFLSAPRRNAVNIIQIDSNGIELMNRVNEIEDQIEILPNVKTVRLMGGCFRPTDTWHELITQNLVVADAKSENNTKEIDYKSNSTKIPLLSPLRSLPNGVCDELIIDRMQKKATLIQRVGEIYATTSYMSASYFSTSSSNNYRNEKSCAFLYNLKDTVLPFNRGETRERAIVCEGLPSYNGNTWNTSIYTCAISGVNSSYDFCFRFPNSETLITLNDSDDMVRKQFNRHLDNKNMKLLYELKTPIITEIDLEGFPYIYKDGHIFLNSEIVPITEITYSINQCQQISASNEDIIRHEKELTYLQKLIAQYVKVDYESALLSLKV